MSIVNTIKAENENDCAPGDTPVFRPCGLPEKYLQCCYDYPIGAGVFRVGHHYQCERDLSV
jgi:hypothetical protein